jgi:Anaerobic c4-dicarboxylate membrane transporter
VAILGAWEQARPLVGGKPMSMVLTIQMFMLLAGALIVALTPTDPAAISKTEVFRAGMVAVVAVFGIAWMADTVFEANLPAIKAALSDVVKADPWTRGGRLRSHLSGICCFTASPADAKSDAIDASSSSTDANSCWRPVTRFSMRPARAPGVASARSFST